MPIDSIILTGHTSFTATVPGCLSENEKMRKNLSCSLPSHKQYNSAVCYKASIMMLCMKKKKEDLF